MSGPRPAWVEYLEAVLVAVVFALFVKTFVFQLFEIPSASMERNLLPGDLVLVNKFVYGPHAGPWARLLPHRDVRRGDVFVFRFPQDPARDFIKRAIGLGGDVIRIQGGRLVKNGVPVEEPYVLPADGEEPSPGGETALSPSIRPRWELEPVTVPPGAVFAMGDNRGSSHDSRFWGPVPESHLRGRALFVLWSYDAGASPRVFTGRGAAVRRLLDTAIHFLGRTRWNRTFQIVR